MNNSYSDIRERIPEPPKWWDECGVPRYCEFTPREQSNIYAREVVLFRIACQGCGHEFDVCLSRDGFTDVHGKLRLSEAPETLADAISKGELHYGDPPNIGCCAAGPTMNSVPKRVLGYWALDDNFSWQRKGELEVDLKPWWTDAA